MANENDNGRKNGFYYLDIVKTIGQFLIYPVAAIIIAMYVQMNDNRIEMITNISSVRLEMKDISATLALHQYTSQRQDTIVKRIADLEGKMDRFENVWIPKRIKSDFDSPLKNRFEK